MHRTPRGGRIAAALATVAIVVAACSSSGGSSPAASAGADTGSPTLERIKKAGTLRAGYAAALPWLGQNPNDNEYFGPNDLIGKRLAEKLGVKLERITQTFDQLVPALQAGTIDLAVAPMYMTETRLKAIAMSAWSKGGFCYLVRKDDDRINKPADLAKPEIRIANFEGTGGFQETSKKYPKAQQVTRAGGPGRRGRCSSRSSRTRPTQRRSTTRSRSSTRSSSPISRSCRRRRSAWRTRTSRPTSGSATRRTTRRSRPTSRTSSRSSQPQLKTELEKYSDPQYLKPNG